MEASKYCFRFIKFSSAVKLTNLKRAQFASTYSDTFFFNISLPLFPTDCWPKTINLNDFGFWWWIFRFNPDIFQSYFFSLPFIIFLTVAECRAKYFHFINSHACTTKRDAECLWGKLCHFYGLYTNSNRCHALRFCERKKTLRKCWEKIFTKCGKILNFS